MDLDAQLTRIDQSASAPPGAAATVKVAGSYMVGNSGSVLCLSGCNWRSTASATFSMRSSGLQYVTPIHQLACRECRKSQSDAGNR